MKYKQGVVCARNIQATLTKTLAYVLYLYNGYKTDKNCVKLQVNRLF